eukprot:COSAG01_NODE_1262_length_10999_cov_12.033853_2_plen_90_part_00
MWQAAGERNFHIFIEIFELPAAMKSQYGLTRPEDYFYINQGGTMRAEGWDDKAEIEGVLAAFKRLRQVVKQYFLHRVLELATKSSRATL